jgi:type VI secretion system protein ImpB
MDDFEPGAVVNQVPALRKLLESRNQLRDLLSKADNSQKLEDLLEGILNDKTQLEALSRQLNAPRPADKGNE